MKVFIVSEIKATFLFYRIVISLRFGGNELSKRSSHNFVSRLNMSNIKTFKCVVTIHIVKLIELFVILTFSQIKIVDVNL